METAAAWRQALKHTDGPVALILSRQKLPVLKDYREKIEKYFCDGAYVLTSSNGKPDIILIASGSEVSLALAAKEQLDDQGIASQVVSMPSWELFESASQSRKEAVFPPEVTCRLAIEAGVPMGWERYTGSSHAIVGITTFGASAPGGLVMEKYGMTTEKVVQEALRLLK